jgi:hypothetical protein
LSRCWDVCGGSGRFEFEEEDACFLIALVKLGDSLESERRRGGKEENAWTGGPAQVHLESTLELENQSGEGDNIRERMQEWKMKGQGDADSKCPPLFERGGKSENGRRKQCEWDLQPANVFTKELGDGNFKPGEFANSVLDIAMRTITPEMARNRIPALQS